MKNFRDMSPKELDAMQAAHERLKDALLGAAQDMEALQPNAELLKVLEPFVSFGEKFFEFRSSVRMVPAPDIVMCHTPGADDNGPHYLQWVHFFDAIIACRGNKPMAKFEAPVQSINSGAEGDGNQT